MATASAVDPVLVWTLRSGRPVGRPRRYFSSLDAGGVSLSPDGRTLAVAAWAGVAIVDVATLRLRTSLPASESVWLAQFTPDGRFIVGGQPRGLGAALVHRNVAADDPAARRTHR